MSIFSGIFKLYYFLMNIVLDVIGLLSFLIGVFGVFIIISGAGAAAMKYIKDKEVHFNQLRCILAEYLILGLDFLVCKDVIDTLLLDSGQEFWKDLVSLVAVVSVRIVLTYFTMKEIDTLKAFIPKSATKKAPVRKKTTAKKK